MEIRLTRRGGFAGISEELGRVDTSGLDASQAHEADELVRSARFFDLPATLPGEIGADLFRYEVTVVDGHRRHAVSFSGEEGNYAGPLAGLLAFVRRVGTARGQ